jgi:hypothetical protein
MISQPRTAGSRWRAPGWKTWVVGLVAMPLGVIWTVDPLLWKIYAPDGRLPIGAPART